MNAQEGENKRQAFRAKQRRISSADTNDFTLGFESQSTRYRCTSLDFHSLVLASRVWHDGCLLNETTLNTFAVNPMNF